jgi:hypothetical protein
MGQTTAPGGMAHPTESKTSLDLVVSLSQEWVKKSTETQIDSVFSLNRAAMAYDLLKIPKQIVDTVGVIIKVCESLTRTIEL